jgi:hypothetical protein
VRRALRIAGLLAAIVLLPPLLVAAWSMLRPNTARVDPALGLESWEAFSGGPHDSNTDLVRWRRRLYLVHARSPWHFGTPRSRILLWRSHDGRDWKQVAEFSVPERDVRDPKLAVIADELRLYVMPNSHFAPRPETTLVASSPNGREWSQLEPVDPPGWIFGKPRTPDGRTWYVPAYRAGMGRVALFASEDGRRWREVSTIHDGEGASETDAIFLRDGRLLATLRLELEAPLFGSPEAATLLATAEPPYEHWSKVRSTTTRLDGPCLFSYRGLVYALGRRDGGAPGLLREPGSILSRKRTALYRVEPDALTWLSDLPSAGDTAYAGAALHAGHVYASYYTSDPGHDYPWLLGMLWPTHVRMVRIPLANLHDVGERPRAPEETRP